MSLRDELRAATLGKSQTPKRELVVIDGKKFFVRQPTVGERFKISDASFDLVGGKHQYNGLKNSVLSIIALTEDEEGTRVYEDADFDGLSATLAGGWFDDLVEAARKVTNVTGEAQKNSEAAQGE